MSQNLARSYRNINFKFNIKMSDKIVVENFQPCFDVKTFQLINKTDNEKLQKTIEKVQKSSKQVFSISMVLSDKSSELNNMTESYEEKPETFSYLEILKIIDSLAQRGLQQLVNIGIVKYLSRAEDIKRGLAGKKNKKLNDVHKKGVKKFKSLKAK